MLAALDAEMPADVRWTKPDGGMFIWLTLPDHMDAVSLLARSFDTVKVAFIPGSAFFADGSGRNTLRLSFAGADERQIDDGIRRLGKLMRETQKATEALAQNTGT